MKIYVNERFLKANKIDKNFKIVNLTDTHFRGDTFSKDIRPAIKCIEKINPNMVSLTGDFIDSLEYGVNYKRELREYLEELASICPTFMSFGSHDLELFLNHNDRDDIHDERLKMQEEYFEFLNSINGNFYPIMPDVIERIDIDNNVSVLGYSYPDSEGPDVEKIHGDTSHMQKYFDAMNIDNKRFNILLCHAPLAFFDKGKFNCECGDFDLILSGHNHAGMIPHCLNFLPIGLMGPDRRILPWHAAGVYQSEKATIAISPGFLKVPGVVMEDIPFLGKVLYQANHLYGREMDLININGEIKKIKKMG